MSPIENIRDMIPRHPPRAPLDPQHELTDAIDGMSDPEKRKLLELIANSLKSEKRKRLRRSQHIKAEVSNGSSRSGNGIIDNIGPEGAFLATRQHHPPGSEIILSFPILNFEFPVKLKAEVIWLSPKGMGLKFKSCQNLDYRLAAQKLADALGTNPREA